MSAPFSRLVVLIPALFSLLLGMWIGVGKAGYGFGAVYLYPHHAAILIGSFFGTLIMLERVITLPSRNALYLPLINGVSIFFFLFNQMDLAYGMLVTGGIVMLSLYLFFYLQQKNVVHFLFFFSAICYIVGFLAHFLDLSYDFRIHYWALYFLFTIVAERIELTRYLNVPSYFSWILAFLLLALSFSHLLSFSYRWYGVMVFLLALFLLRYDIAGKNIRSKDPHRFRGWALYVGYGWLLIHAITSFFFTQSNIDMRVHSFFLGFVMNMVFAHAGIILPAVLKKTMVFHAPSAYVVFIVFQVVIMLRFLFSHIRSPFFSLVALSTMLVVVAFFVVQARMLQMRK